MNINSPKIGAATPTNGNSGKADNSSLASAGTPTPAFFDDVKRALKGLRFGAVEIVVHDGRITYVERRERLRWQKEDR